MFCRSGAKDILIRHFILNLIYFTFPQYIFLCNKNKLNGGEVF